MRRAHGAAALLLALAVLTAAASGAQQDPVEPGPPPDARLHPPKDLNGYFPFAPSATPEAWAARAAEVRRQMRVALGLWPWPERTPLKAVVHGRVDREAYTVERVFFESYPGHFVTGSLYRPKGRSGRRPGVLSPHGHWPGGRFQEIAEGDVRKQIADGAERFEVGGRHVLQSRAVQLARMGAVVFLFDMVGYADSQQIPESVAHRFQTGRPHMNGEDGWGFFSPRAELHAQSILGLQAWNAIRALDFVAALPDVDPARLAVTGASGGGTQTFLLGALDERPAVAFPAVMVSTAMQGGCTCENASWLRVGTGNVEFAALFAPKPLGMTAANDWTRDMATRGFPELQRHWTMLGAPDGVMLRPLTHFGHNYNAVSRSAMYGWLNTHLGLGAPEPVIERDFEPLTRDEATVWSDAHPAPPGGEAHEKALTRWMADDAARQIGAMGLATAAGLDAYRTLVGGAWEVFAGRTAPRAGAVTVARESTTEQKAVRRTEGLLRDAETGAALPFVRLERASARPHVVVWISARGREGVDRAADRLVSSGVRVLALDLLGQGALATGADGNRLVDTPREFAGYTFGYNRPLVAERVRDVQTAVRYARDLAGESGRVDLVALDGGAAWVLAAAALAPDAVARVAVHTRGFRFAGAAGFTDPSFLPGAVKYGDLPGLLPLVASTRLWIAGEPQAIVDAARPAWRGVSRADAIVRAAGPEREMAEAVVRWLGR